MEIIPTKFDLTLLMAEPSGSVSLSTFGGNQEPRTLKWKRLK